MRRETSRKTAGQTPQDAHLFLALSRVYARMKSATHEFFRA